MNIIIPMAGAGQRFKDAGYKVGKPVLPVINRKDGKEYPMVVCAVMDLPGVEQDGRNVTFIERDFHKEDGTEEMIREYYPEASFIAIDRLTDGQACTCLLARDKINNNEPLLIAGCDNGMSFPLASFEHMEKKCDVMIFTYKHNSSVLKNPNAYGWVIVDEDSCKVTGVSVKKALSNTPMEDHAIVATFWFNRGGDFVRAAEKMIQEEDRINGEFYVDQVIAHCLELRFDVKAFEIERYIGWGTPKDYEEYTSTIKYWKDYVTNESLLHQT